MLTDNQGDCQMKVLLILPAVLLSGCVTPASDPYTTIERRGDSREAGIIEELNISGCNIKRFETMTSSRKSAITVVCK